MKKLLIEMSNEKTKTGDTFNNLEEILQERVILPDLVADIKQKITQINQ
jgi:hypothetical protein